MGIKGAHSFTHSISKVTIGELLQIAKGRKKCNNQSTAGVVADTIGARPTIDIDASWIFRSTGIKLDNRLDWMMNLALELVRNGFIVVFVCDGENRHHSKRATVERKAKYQKVAIDTYIKKAELMKLAEMRINSNSIEEINQIIVKENALSNKLKTMETNQQATKINVGDEFFINIQNAIEDIDLLQTKFYQIGYILVVKSEFQADSVLAYRCVMGLSDIVFSSDSDLVALAGSCCLGIKSYKFNEKSKYDKLSEIILYTPSSVVLNQVLESIHLCINSTRVMQSDHNFFDDEVDDIRIRGLIAVGLGCDVYLPGINNLGKAKMKKFIDDADILTFENIIDFYYSFLNKKKVCRKRKDSNEHNTSVDDININNLNNMDNNLDTFISKEIFIDAMNVYVDALIYEPANYYEDEIIEEKAKYITKDIPIRLHKYIEAFSSNDPNISIYESGNNVMECIGTGCGEHCFLDYEEHFKCTACKNVICKYCMIDDNNINYCYQCYLSEIAVVSNKVTNQPTMREMRKELLEIGVETTNDDNISDITDLFDAMIENKSDYSYALSNTFDEVTLPLYPSTYLDSESILFRFDPKNGGSFIRNNLCSLNNKLDIIILMSKLVQTGNAKFKSGIDNMYSILPDIIVNFAERSRLHSGYRLLKRAVRHAMDPLGVSIMSSKCCVVEYGKTIGIHISHCIKASMKKDVYKVKLSLTSTDILAVSCTCKAGSCKDEKVICVHILPCILQLSILLYDGLSEHLLCEFANEFNSEIEKQISAEEKTKDVRDAIILLKRANSDIDNDALYNSLTIDELLHKYKVGTEIFKKGPGPPASTSNLGPLRNMTFVSPLILAREIMYKKEIPENQISNDI